MRNVYTIPLHSGRALYIHKMNSKGGPMIEYKPVADWIYVIPDEPKISKGGLVMPDTVGEDGAPRRYFNGMGLVVSCGPGRHDANGNLLPMPCKEGERILFYFRNSYCHKPHDKEIMIVQAEAVIAVVTGECEADYQPNKFYSKVQNVAHN
jgi:co-chaperonin GroES (HSP10)